MAETERRSATRLPQARCEACLKKRPCHTYGPPSESRKLCWPCLAKLVHQALK